jgi:hypothetical protein
MDILSINFSMVFIIMSNLSSKDRDIDGCASPWGQLSLGFIFPDAIMFTSTSIELLIIASRFADLLSLSSRAKSLSKNSAYRNCATPGGGGGGFTSAGMKLYTVSTP